MIWGMADCSARARDHQKAVYLKRAMYLRKQWISASVLYEHLCTDTDAAGQPSFSAQLARLRAEWRDRRQLVDRWERERRRLATLGGIWDDLWDGCRCATCIALEADGARDDARFAREHYAELKRLAESLFARTADVVTARMEVWARAMDPKWGKRDALFDLLSAEQGRPLI